MIFPVGSFSVIKASKVAAELLRRPAMAGRRFFALPAAAGAGSVPAASG
jgi:hypothetical protein